MGVHSRALPRSPWHHFRSQLAPDTALTWTVQGKCYSLKTLKKGEGMKRNIRTVSVEIQHFRPKILAHPPYEGVLARGGDVGMKSRQRS